MTGARFPERGPGVLFFTELGRIPYRWRITPEPASGNPMNPIPLLQFLALASFGALALSAAAPVAVAVEPAKEDNLLSVGETKRFADDLKITFLALKKDTRCPINAKCLSAGDAVAFLSADAGG